MDPVCHSLAGAALAETGLKTKTRFATAVLIVSANVPDIDVLAMFLGGNAGFVVRRGITHGVIGILVLPVIVAFVFHWFGRLRPRPEQAVNFKTLLLLSYLGALTHPLLDLLNVYGVRLLMPFSDRWFYGDILFIVDPVLWFLFGWGVVRARRKKSQGRHFWFKPARASLVVATAYVLAMFGAARWFSSLATGELIAAGITPGRVMLGPVPLNPFRRWLVATVDGEYRVGIFDLFGEPRVDLYEDAIPIADGSMVATEAADDPGVANFLYWARFPFFTIEERIGGTMVRVGDARYTVDPQGSWASTELWMPRRRRSP